MADFDDYLMARVEEMNRLAKATALTDRPIAPLTTVQSLRGRIADDSGPLIFDDPDARAFERVMQHSNVHPESCPPVHDVSNGETGELCAFTLLHHYPLLRNGDMLADELWRLDYSPVMKYFLERTLETVRFERETDRFFFIFKDERRAITYHRSPKSWEHLMLTTTAASSAQSAVIDFCHNCNRRFQHPPHNRPLEYCPNCGAPTSYSAGSPANQGIAGPSPASSVPAPSGVPPANLITSPDFAPVMRCPGGCGSEVRAGRYDAGQTYLTSSCPYSCKVRVELWNKRVDEARSK